MEYMGELINKEKVAFYARSNFNRRNPASGNGLVPYFDFSIIPDNYDCTNFVSHALLAGGAQVYNDGDPATGWYYVDLNNRSYSWAGVQSLYNFLINNKGEGPSGTSKEYYAFDKDEEAPYDIGDIIQFHNGLVWGHSAVITGYYPLKPNKVGALVTGRTSPTRYEDNEKAENIYKGEMKRVIKI